MSADAFRQVERAAWEAGAVAYWEGFAAVFEPAAAQLLDRLGVGEGDRVLDVATGPGFVAGDAAARGAQVVGVDMSHAMVDLGARLYPAARFLQADAEALPLRRSLFDLAVSNLGLSHVARPTRMVGEMARVTRAGGCVALTTHDEAGATALVGLVNDAVVECGATRPPALPLGPSVFHHGFPGDETFARLLEASGLESVRVERIGLCHRTTADDLWQALSRGSTSVALFLDGQQETTRGRLKMAFLGLATRFGPPGRLEVPISIKLAAGTTPRS